jgi:S1-C subfamily serine protease
MNSEEVDMPVESKESVGPVAIVAGVVGAVVALAIGGIALATGIVDGHTTTRVVQRDSSPAPVSTTGKGGGLDARSIYAADSPGVAFVKSSGITTNTPFGSSQGVATGSGFVIDKKGDILTNAHVVAGAQKVTVRLGASGSETAATVVGVDNSNDLAVLHVDPSKVTLHPLRLGKSTGQQVGDPVMAIGNPFGYDRTATTGIVSALQRQITGPDGFTIDHVIQTDAAINPGNSGGPLIDAAGRVIAINSQIATGGSGDANVGIGFAIPIDTARHELSTLEKGGKVQHAFLGVVVGSAKGGAVIRRVDTGSPADQAGLKVGDVIVSVDGQKVGSADALTQAIGGHGPGDTVTLEYSRGGMHRTTRADLAARPSSVPASQGGAP